MMKSHVDFEVMRITIQFRFLQWLALAQALACCVGIQAQPSSQPDGNFWVPDGPVQALAETNGILYIGGEFNHVRPVTGSFVPIHRETGEIAGPFEQIFGTVEIAIPDGNAGWFLGGDFTAVGSVPRTNMAHILADRSVDPAWAVVPNGRVLTGVLTAGRLFIGGEFSEINGQPRTYLAALNPQTAELLPLSLDIPLDGVVWSMAAGDSYLYFGGRFTTVMGQARAHLAALDLSNNQLADWHADSDTRTGFGGVTMLSLAGGRLYVAGDFGTISSSNRNGVAALDPVTARVLPWNPNVSGTIPVVAVAVRSNLVYIAGHFANVGNVYRPSIAAVDIETGALANWGPTIEPGWISAMALVGDKLYIGGGLAALDMDTGQFLDWDPSPGGSATLIVPVPNGDLLYIGGDFRSFGGVARKNLAALDSVTGIPTPWNPGVDGGVFALALAGDALYAGGAFGSVSGIQRTGLCAISISNGSLLPFDARLGFSAGVSVLTRTLAVAGSNLFAGGSFSTAGNIPAGGFAVLDRQTGQATGWTPSPTGSISAFAVSGKQLYLSGTFTNLNGQTRTRLASFDWGTRQLTDWHPTLDAPANVLFANASQLFLSGSFTRVNGGARLRLASLDVETGQLNAWSPSVPSTFFSMTTLGSTFFGVGTGGLRRSIDAVDGHPTVWNPTFLRDGLQPNLQCALGTARGLFVGGDFGDVNGRFRPWLARFPVTNLPPVVSLLAPSNSAVVHLPSAMPLEANAADTDGTVQSVKYYVNGNVVAVATQPPFSASWTPQVISNYVVIAVAVDDVGERGESLSAHVAAIPPLNDVPPSVQFTAPMDGAVLRQGSAVVLSANASDSDSRLVGVQFFLGTNLVAFITNAPFTTPLTNLARGTYTAMARAVDEFGVTATNGPIAFRVNVFPTVSWVSPPASTKIPFGTNLFLNVTASDSDGVVRSVSFFSGTNLLAVKTNLPFTLTVSNLPLGNYIFTADAVDDLGSHGVSPPLTVLVYPSPSVLTTLINSNSTWKYLDDGSNQGELWRTNTYDDTGWSNGVAEFGYGDGDEVTVVRSNRTDLTRIVTTYFRRHFNVVQPSLYFDLVVRLKRDDGGVVYLNGLEVFRSNMTNGPGIPVLFNDLAVVATNEVSFFSTDAPASLLRPGDNLVAVEIHQTSLTSSDISFDLQLQAESGPLLFISQSGGMVTLSWLPAVPGLELQRALTPSGPWSPAPDQVNNPQSFMTSPMDAPTFWRLRVP